MNKWYINGVEMTGRGVLVKTGYSASCAALSRSVYSGGCGLYIATSAKIGLKTLSIPLRIVRRTTEGADSVRSWLLSLCLERENEIMLPNGKQYRAALIKAQKPKKEAEGILDFTLEFSGFEHGEPVTATTPTIFCPSTAPETPCKITGKVGTAGAYSMAGVEFTDCAKDDVIVLDGLIGSVTVNGQPADMSKNNFVSFPTLHPGENSVLCDTVATVAFFPIFL